MSLIEVAQPWSDAYDGSPDFDGVNTVLGLIPSAGVYTATQNIAADTLTIRSGVRLLLRGYCIWARNLIIENGGFLSANGNSATNQTQGNGLTNSGFLGFSSGSGGPADFWNAAGANRNGSAGGNTANAVGGNGGAGGNSTGATGGAAGTATALASAYVRFWRSVDMPYQNWRMLSTGVGGSWITYSAGAGGSGGGLTTTTQTGTDSLYGGGGGAGGGVFGIRCGNLNNLGTIEARGGNGGNAGRSGTSIEGNAAGGGGGGGGAIHIVTDLITNYGTISTAGGAGGTAAQFGAIGPAQNGANGVAGILAVFMRGQPI